MRSLSAQCKSKIKYFVSKFFLLALGIILSKCSTTTIDLSNHNWQDQRALLEKTSDWQLRGALMSDIKVNHIPLVFNGNSRETITEFASGEPLMQVIP